MVEVVETFTDPRATTILGKQTLGKIQVSIYKLSTTIRLASCSETRVQVSIILERQAVASFFDMLSARSRKRRALFNLCFVWQQYS